MGGRLKWKVGQKGEEITKGLVPVREFVFVFWEIVPIIPGVFSKFHRPDSWQRPT